MRNISFIMKAGVATIAVLTLGISSAAAETPPPAEQVYVVGVDGSLTPLGASGTPEAASLLAHRLDGPMTAEEMEQLVAALPEGGQSLTIVAVPQTATRSQARAAVAVAGKCESSTQGVWARKSSGYGAVGTKPKTACTNPARSHKIETSLLKRTAFGFKQQGSTFTGGNTGEKNYQNTHIELRCTNSKSTDWQAANVHTTIDYAGCKIILLSRSGVSSAECGT